MRRLRFNVGDVVLVVVIGPERLPLHVGSVGTIDAIGGVDTNGQFWQYIVDCPDDPDWVSGFDDYQLVRIHPPVGARRTAHENDTDANA